VVLPARPALQDDGLSLVESRLEIAMARAGGGGGCSLHRCPATGRLQMAYPPPFFPIAN
jgi:hypothetical protein